MSELRPLNILLLAPPSFPDTTPLGALLDSASFASSIVKAGAIEEYSPENRGADPHIILVHRDLLPIIAASIETLKRGSNPTVSIIFLSPAGEISELNAALSAGAVDLVDAHNFSAIATSIVRAIHLQGIRHELDATNRKLIKSDRRFAAVFSHSPVPMLVTETIDGKIVDINPAAESLFNIPRRQIIGRQTIEFGSWTDLDQRRRLIADALFGGRNHSIERRVTFPDGPSFTFLVSFCSIEYEGKSRLLAMIEDITARKAAEDTLRESEERYRLLVENSHDLITEMDQDHRFCYVSANHFAIAGYLAEELLAKDLFAFVHPDDLEFLAERFASFASCAQMRIRFRHQKGHWLTLDCAAQVYTTSIGTRRAVVISRDITATLQSAAARHDLELQLRQAQKMEAIGTLAGGIAHDFNNILTAIFGYLQLVQLETPDDSPVREELEGALEASERARELVAQILTFSRRREQQRALGKVAPVIKDALRLLRASLPATIEFQTHIDERTPAILCDATQLHQVVMNLVTNAGHAMSDHGGILTVQLSQVDADPALHASYPQLTNRQTLCLSVSDTGCGMDAATRERIFEPFFTTKSASEGTGLGLAVVHGIVQDHDGAILCESETGKGTCFRIFFPTVDPAVLDIVSTPHELSKGRGERVLLVDDEQSVVSIASRMIKRLGYHVEAFTDAPAALARFTEAPREFDIVLTDLTMGGATGVDIARRVFELRPGLPLIIATGFMNARDVETARALGVKRFLEKPFSFTALAENLSSALAAKSTP